MRVVFLGTPEFAVIPLDALAQDSRYEVVGVVTQPDRPAGRSTAPQPTPVKAAGQRLGIPIIQPETLRDPVAVEQLAALQPDVGVVAAYGEILRKNVLAIPPLGYINIHPSLLPLHRGPAPVLGAILAGNTETGVSLIRLVSKMDAGPILAQRTVPLPPDARAGSLTEQLFHLGSAMLVETLAAYAAGNVNLVEQDDEQATFTKLLTRADGQINWATPAVQIERMTRAYDPWPGAYTFWRGQQLKIIAARPVDWSGAEPPGALLAQRDGVLIATGSGALELLTIQPAGKRPMPADDWRRGQRDVTGAVFGG
jgi:methionyl-tRNA formyltransferase